MCQTIIALELAPYGWSWLHIDGDGSISIELAPYISIDGAGSISMELAPYISIDGAGSILMELAPCG